MAYTPRLKEEYKSRVIAALKEEFGYKNVMEVPKLEKIVLSKGVGAAVSDKKLIGAKVTLRGDRMYEFLDRLVTSSLPRVRDFNGIKATGFDGRGNYNLGVLEQIIFPEIDIDKVNKISGMDISFVTNAKTDKEAKSLLAELGLPFKKN